MDSKQRFTSRVDSYIKYRPSYPTEAIDYMYNVVGMRSDSIIADIGAGTGIFSKLLLERGSRVIAVEPNQKMREAAEKWLAGEPNFQAVPGSAEKTGLQDRSVDFIVCAQAFHWFDRKAAKAEFGRILKPSGKVVLVWNTRKISGTPFLEEYEKLLHDFGIDYAKVNHKNVSPEILRDFFQKGTMREARFRMDQQFDFESLKGRLLSSSYSPMPDHPNYEPMMEELRRIYERNQMDGTILFEYETEVFWGRV